MKSVFIHGLFFIAPEGLEARTPPTAQGGKAAQDVLRQGTEGRSRRERQGVSTIVTESYPRSLA
jgi:hypothetical protein